MTARSLFLATAVSITVATATARAADDVLDELPTPTTPTTATTAVVKLSPQQQFIQALGDHPGLVRLSPATGINAVCDEYLDRRFEIKTIVLSTKDEAVKRLAREHNQRKRRELAKAVGPKKWRRALNHAVVEAARRDLRAGGPYRLIVVKPMTDDDKAYWKFLENHYGIRILQTGYDLSGEYDVELYNMVIRAAMQKHFHRDVLTSTPVKSKVRWHRP